MAIVEVVIGFQRFIRLKILSGVLPLCFNQIGVDVAELKIWTQR